MRSAKYMNLNVIEARMIQGKDQSYSGYVRFRTEGGHTVYELSLGSEKGDEWLYNLHFTEESGDDEEIDEVSRLIDEDDEIFDELLQSALNNVIHKE
jgi:hypothetical protein